jgi:ABC-type dipeptide/oligopeptide/nickel transport system permease subunit
MDAVRRFFDSDVFYSFKRSPATIVASATLLACILAAAFAPWVAPHNPFDLKTLNLLDAFTPPVFSASGTRNYLMGTDDQGRDVLSAIIFGSRMSLIIGRSSASRWASSAATPAAGSTASSCAWPTSSCRSRRSSSRCSSTAWRG